MKTALFALGLVTLGTLGSIGTAANADAGYGHSHGYRSYGYVRTYSYVYRPVYRSYTVRHFHH